MEPRTNEQGPRTKQPKDLKCRLHLLSQCAYVRTCVYGIQFGPGTGSASILIAITCIAPAPTRAQAQAQAAPVGHLIWLCLPLAHAHHTRFVILCKPCEQQTKSDAVTDPHKPRLSNCLSHLNSSLYIYLLYEQSFAVNKLAL